MLSNAHINGLSARTCGRHDSNSGIGDRLLKERSAGEELVQNKSCRPNIERRPDADCGMERDTCDVASGVCWCECGTVPHRSPEIDELKLAMCSKAHEVMRLDITVNEPDVMDAGYEL
eukprot:scaffold260375_cov27-Tisochrysis_lutea.AAC.1